MRIANARGRLILLTARGGIDVETASDGRFGPDPETAFVRWSEFRAWAEMAGAASSAAPVREGDLGSPAPRPAQVFGIGLNYRDHAAEAGLPLPDRPATFTKFPTCITGPYADVELPIVQPPVLVIHGLDDPFLLAAALDRTWEWVAQPLTLVTIPGAGHFVQQDASALVTKTIKRWLVGEGVRR